MTYGIYRLLTRLIFIVISPIFLIYSGITGKHRAGLRQRLGCYNNITPPPAGTPVIWLHGASVGEVMAARILATKIKKEFPVTALILSTVTEQGLKIARKQFGEMANCILAPLDLPGGVARAVETIRPDIYICLETELWPNLLTRLQNDPTRLFLLNGRLSERSSRRYRWVKGFSKKVLGGFDTIATITKGDKDRFISLGADENKIIVTGNSKYDLPEPPSPTASRTNWRQRLNLDDKQPVLIGGSTHTGEEEMLLEVFHNLKNTLTDLVLIVAPRHITRLKEIQTMLATRHTDYDLFSAVKRDGHRRNIIVVDSIGELAELYAAADVIFCGGSLVPRGGHNIMEAAIWGIPVFYGPCMKDFTDARQLLDGNGGIMVDNHQELADKIRELFLDPRLYDKVASAARLTARSQQGAADQQLAPVFDAIRRICSNNATDN